MKAFFTAFKAKFDTSNQFNTAVGGRFRYGEALQEWESAPYALYAGGESTPDDTFDTLFETTTVQVSCYAADPGTAQANMELAEALYNGASLAVSGYQNVFLRRVFKTHAMQDDNKWLAAVEFEGRLIKL